MLFLSNQGSVDAKGTYQELMLSGKDFAKLLSSSQDENNPEAEKPPPMSRRTSARVKILIQKSFISFVYASFNSSTQ